MHHPQLYANLHKLHHKFKAPYALTALYCTGYESIFLNVFSTSLGCVILQIPPLFLYIWFFLVSLNSVLTHSGLKFSFLIDGTHDDHHKFFNYNYGISGYIDMIYGTCLPNITEKKEEEKKEKNEEEEKTHLGNFKIDELKI
jgi:sterol desaturase/sphingolipid hydroxylase (fatty acid hydroxylase superfamily)